LFVNITVILNISVRYKDEILLVKDAKPNQQLDIVRCSYVFVITVIVITEFDFTNLTALTILVGNMDIFVTDSLDRSTIMV